MSYLTDSSFLVAFIHRRKVPGTRTRQASACTCHVCLEFFVFFNFVILLSVIISCRRFADLLFLSFFFFFFINDIIKIIFGHKKLFLFVVILRP